MIYIVSMVMKGRRSLGLSGLGFGAGERSRDVRINTKLDFIV